MGSERKLRTLVGLVCGGIPLSGLNYPSIYTRVNKNGLTSWNIDTGSEHVVLSFCEYSFYKGQIISSTDFFIHAMDQMYRCGITKWKTIHACWKGGLHFSLPIISKYVIAFVLPKLNFRHVLQVSMMRPGMDSRAMTNIFQLSKKASFRRHLNAALYILESGNCMTIVFNLSYVLLLPNPHELSKSIFL